MKSILHDKKERTCFLCMRLHGDDSWKDVLHEHHVFFGWANRRISEKHGMKVYLCLEHHETGEEAVHRNKEINKMLQAYAQRKFEEKWPNKDFISIFGRNYILDEKDGHIEENQEKMVHQVSGFTFISDGLEGVDW